MKAIGLSGDLEWWRANRNSPDADAAAMLDLLERLKVWKAQHDRDRAGQPGAFLQMVWDGIFGDDDSRVVEAIRELEDALADPRGEGGEGEASRQPEGA